MADPRFFDNAGPFTLAELARRCGAGLVSENDAERQVVDVQPLAAAGPEHLSFIDNKKYIPAFMTSKAGGCILHPSLVAKAPAGMALLAAMLEGAPPVARSRRM